MAVPVSCLTNNQMSPEDSKESLTAKFHSFRYKHQTKPTSAGGGKKCGGNKIGKMSSSNKKISFYIISVFGLSIIETRNIVGLN